jgi:hypothetical protein
MNDQRITLHEGMNLEFRTKNGGVRTTISIDAEPIVHRFATQKLAQPVAEAIKTRIVEQIRAISRQAAPATIERRVRAVKELAKGLKTAAKRYSGGRTGVRQPNQSDSLFRDSDRLAAGLIVKQNTTDKTFTINVTANRLDPSTFSPAAFMRMVTMLRELVPALQNPLGEKAVQQAIEDTFGEIFVREMANRSRLKVARLRALTSLAGGI